MQKLQASDQNGLKRPKRCFLAYGIIGAVQSRLHHLDVPVAELAPDKVIDLLDSDAQLKLFHVLGDIRYHMVELGQNPLILRLKSLRHGRSIRLLPVLHVHHDEAGSIPYLISEVPAVLHALNIEAHVVAGRIPCNQGETQCIRAVFVDDLKGINAIAERLRHLASL